MRTYLCLSLLALGALAPRASAQSQPPAQLGPGDVIRITVWRKPELSGDFDVQADSSVAHPLFREVKVAGVPVETAQQRVGTLLARYETSPQFVVQPLFRIAVGGEVRQPNLYPMRLGTTIGQAVAVAGGATERAELRRVELRRGGQAVLLDLAHPSTAVSLMEVRSGDQIVVPQKGDTFRQYVVPAASVVAALATLITLLRK
ncbi:MAG TPA: polysaccharide biosynthesis/export family protein [Longimicrobiaceae bacterium]|jgi:polysaccharide export outer membrane protein|nr:polysaccharide biosynthesis/export family protein [Longimicrobiaceae bacterium]